MHFILNVSATAPQRSKFLQTTLKCQRNLKCLLKFLGRYWLRDEHTIGKAHLPIIPQFLDELNLSLKLWDYQHCSPTCSWIYWTITKIMPKQWKKSIIYLIEELQKLIYQEFFCCSVYLHIYDPQHIESASITRFTRSICKRRNFEFIKWYVAWIYFHIRKINTCELDPILSRGYRWLTLPP